MCSSLFLGSLISLSESSGVSRVAFNKDSKFFYKSFESAAFDPIVIMTKFYPLIINYALKKGLDPDKPRYLTKITQTY